MDDNKSIAFFVMIMAAYGIYLEYRNLLVPVLTEITTSVPNGPSLNPNNTLINTLTNTTVIATGGQSIANFMIAFVVYLLVTSAIDDTATLWLSLLLVLGALVSNTRVNNGHGVFQTIEGN